MQYVQKNDTRLINQYNCFLHKDNWEDGSILPKHELETDQGYTRRKAGFCSPDLYTYLIKTYGILFAKNPTRTNYDSVYGLFLDDCGYGQNLNAFMQNALELSAVLGSVAIVMDSDKEQPADLEGMTIARTFPFMEIILPQNITQLVVDRVGRLIEFGYKYYKSTDQTHTTLYYKTYANGMLTESYEGKNAKGETMTVIEPAVEIPFGRIPVIMVVPSQEPLVTSRVPSSPTLGLYQQQLNIAVTNSLMDESLYAQQFSVLAFFTQLDTKSVKLGTSTGVRLDQNDRLEFVSPQGTSIDLMSKRVDQSVQMMIRTFANMLTNGTVQSGDAKVIDRQVGSMQLKNVSNYLEQIEYKIYEMFQGFMGNDVVQTGYDYTVTYYKDFDLTDISGYIAQAIEMLGTNISDDAKTFIRSVLLKKFLSGEDSIKVSELVEAEMVNKEIEAVEGLDTMKNEDDSSDDNAEENKNDLSKVADVAISTGNAVQNTALNGAQVTSLVEIIASVKSSSIPKESAKAIIMAAFPAISSTLVDSMLSSIVPQIPTLPTV